MKFIERLESTRQSFRNALRNDWDKKKSRLGGPIRVKDNEFSTYIPFTSTKKSQVPISVYEYVSKQEQTPIDCRLSLRLCEEQYEQRSNAYIPERQKHSYHRPLPESIHGRRTRIRTNPWYHQSNQTNIYSKPFENEYSTPKENDYEEISSRRNLTLLGRKRRQDFDDSYPHSRLSFIDYQNRSENIDSSSKEFLLQRHKLCSAIQNIYGETKKRSPLKTFKLQPVPPKRTHSSLSYTPNSLSSSPSHLNSNFSTQKQTLIPSRKVSRLQAKLQNIVHDAVQQTKSKLDL